MILKCEKTHLLFPSLTRWAFLYCSIIVCLCLKLLIKKIFFSLNNHQAQIGLGGGGGQAQPEGLLGAVTIVAKTIEWQPECSWLMLLLLSWLLCVTLNSSIIDEDLFYMDVRIWKSFCHTKTKQLLGSVDVS